MLGDTPVRIKGVVVRPAETVSFTEMVQPGHPVEPAVNLTDGFALVINDEQLNIHKIVEGQIEERTVITRYL